MQRHVNVTQRNFLEKTVFSCGVHTHNVLQQIMEEKPIFGGCSRPKKTAEHALTL